MSLTLDLAAGVELCADVVRRATDAGATDAEAVHASTELFEINFETTEVGLVRSTVSDAVNIAVYVDGAKGTAAVTGRSHDDLDRGVSEALAAARADRPDPGNVVLDDEASPLEEHGHASPDRDAMVGAVLGAIETVGREFPKVLLNDACNYAFRNRWRSFANSRGVTRQERRGGYSVSLMFTGKDGLATTSFNFGGQTSAEPFADLLDAGIIRRLLAETEASFDPSPVPETFVGDVLLTPSAVETMLGAIATPLGGMSLLQGTSVFADSVGESIASPLVTLRNQPTSARFADAKGFDDHGVRASDLDVIVDGVLQDHLIGWYTGHKLDRPVNAAATAFALDAGDAEVDDMVAQMERGVVLGRYSGGIPNQNLDFSGVAKNSFYVEDGRIVGPIAETMIAGGFRDLLRNVRAVSAEVVNDGSSEVPYLLTSGATISTR